MIILDPISGNRVTISLSDKPRRAVLLEAPASQSETGSAGETGTRPSGTRKLNS